MNFLTIYVVAHVFINFILLNKQREYYAVKVMSSFENHVHQ